MRRMVVLPRSPQPPSPHAEVRAVGRHRRLDVRGGRTALDAGIADIQFSIANEVLDPDHFVCNPDGSPSGVDLGIFLLGDYQLNDHGRGRSGGRDHQVVQTHCMSAPRKSGRNCASINASSDVCDEFAVDVPRVALSTTALLKWTFSHGVIAPRPTCSR